MGSGMWEQWSSTNKQISTKSCRGIRVTFREDPRCSRRMFRRLRIVAHRSGNLHRSTGSISSSVNEGTKAGFSFGSLNVEDSIAAILFVPMLDPCRQSTHFPPHPENMSASAIRRDDKLRKFPRKIISLITPSRPFLRRTSNRCFFGGPLSYWPGYCLLIACDCISSPGSRRLLKEHEPSIRLKSSGLEIPLGPPIGLV
jgi:hypothetical protein